MKYYFYNKVVVVDNLCSPIYEKAIFVLREKSVTKSLTKDMVKEAEKIIENYVQNQSYLVSTASQKKICRNTSVKRDRILNWCLIGSSGLLVYFLIQLCM